MKPMTITHRRFCVRVVACIAGVGSVQVATGVSLGAFSPRHEMRNLSGFQVGSPTRGTKDTAGQLEEGSATPQSGDSPVASPARIAVQDLSERELRFLAIGDSPDSDALGLRFPAQFAPDIVRAICLMSPGIRADEVDKVVAAVSEVEAAESELRVKILMPVWRAVRATTESELAGKEMTARCKRITSLYRAAFESFAEEARALYESALRGPLGSDRAIAVSTELSAYMRLDPCRLWGMGPPSAVRSPVWALLESFRAVSAAPDDKAALGAAGSVIADATEELNSAYASLVSVRMLALADARTRAQISRTQPGTTEEERAKRKALWQEATERANISRKRAGDAYLRVAAVHKRLLGDLLAALPVGMTVQYHQHYLRLQLGSLASCPWDPLPLVRAISSRHGISKEFAQTASDAFGDSIRQYQTDALAAMDLHLTEILREPLSFQSTSSAKARKAIGEAQESARRRALALVMQAEAHVPPEGSDEWQKSLAQWEQRCKTDAETALNTSGII